MNLEIKNAGDTITGVLSGRLDTAASTQFATDMQPLLDNANLHIVLDCAALEFISSSGLRLFLTLRKAATAKGGDITIIGMNSDIRQVFTITGFFPLFKFE